MLKAVTILEFEKGEKKFPLYLMEQTTHADLFDLSFQIRDFALKGMEEIAKQQEDAKAKSIPVDLPSEDVQKN